MCISFHQQLPLMPQPPSSPPSSNKKCPTWQNIWRWPLPQHPPKSTCDFLLVFLWEYAIDVCTSCAAGFPFVVALIKARLTSNFRLCFYVLSRSKWLTWITQHTKSLLLLSPSKMYFLFQLIKQQNQNIGFTGTGKCKT